MIKKIALSTVLLLGLSATADAKAATLPGYHLATISSAAENDFIRSLINDLNGGEYWLGGSQPDSAASGDLWSWENDEGLFWDLGAVVGGSYANWNPSEPNGDGRQLAMWADNNPFGFTSGTWNDEGALTGGWLAGYVMESIPEPGIIALFSLGLAGFGLARRKKA